MSGNPSTPPGGRRVLPWQQRRPVSSQHRKTASTSAADSLQTPPPIQSTVPDRPSPLAGNPHRQSVSSLTQSFSTPPAASQSSVSSLTQSFSTPPAASQSFATATNTPTNTPTAPPPSTRSNRNSVIIKPGPGTFAPQFIKSSDEVRPSPLAVGGVGILGENSDFSGRRWVWVKDPERTFVKGEVLSDEDGILTVRCDNGAVSWKLWSVRARTWS